MAQATNHLCLIYKSAFMTEQQVTIGDCNNIIVENTGIDGVRLLLCINNPYRIQPMLTCHRLTGFKGLTRREAVRS